MAKFNQGDIVLIPYSYTDLSNTKKRSVVIISKDELTKKTLLFLKLEKIDSHSIKEDDIDKKLKFKSEVWTSEIFAVHKSLIIKKLVSFQKELLRHLTERIKGNSAVKR